VTPTRVHGGVDRQGVGTLCYPSHSLTLSSMFIIRQTPSVTFQSRLPFAHSSHVVTLRVYPMGCTRTLELVHSRVRYFMTGLLGVGHVHWLIWNRYSPVYTSLVLDMSLY
jgi:hypothetical protein